MDVKTTMLNTTNLIIGCSAGMAATCIVYPLDVLKIRMQLGDTQILKNEGIPALYHGLSASLLRQATYTTTRLGLYTWMFKLASNSGYPGLGIQMSLGTLAGCVSSFVWTPAEIAFIRMAADSSLPLAERRKYKNAFDALSRISREEGFFTLWQGAVVTLDYTLIVSGMHTNSFIFTLLILASTEYFETVLSIYVTSFAISGLITTAVALPIDIAKTRIQNMRTVAGKPECSCDLYNVWINIIRNEGFFALWKGFFPHYARLLLHTALTSIFTAKMIFQQLPDFPSFSPFS